MIIPAIVVIGEAPSDKLHYLSNHNTITQNTAGDIVFECETGKVHIYVSIQNYSVTFLNNEGKDDKYGDYIGTLDV